MPTEPQSSPIIAPAASPAGALRNLANAQDRVGALRTIGRLTREALDATGSGLQLVGADLAGLHLAGFDLRGANLNRAQLYGTDFTDANLEGASLVCAGTERSSFRNVNLRNAYLHAFSAQVCDLSDADLRHVVDATGSLFHGCKLSRARMDGAVLAGATFYQSDLTDASLQSCNVQGATLNECVLARVALCQAECSEASITKCYADGIDLSGATGEGASMRRLTSFNGVSFRSARLPGLTLSGLRGAGVQAEALFAPDAHIINSSLHCVDIRNGDLSRCSFRNVTLSESDLSGCRLTGASLIHVDAPRLNLAHAHGENLQIIECRLEDAVLEEFEGRSIVIRDSNLRSANLRGAYLYRAMITGDPPHAMDLRGGNLRGSNLVQAYIAADLEGAALVGANCAYARFNQSRFDKANLSGANLFQISAVKVSCIEADLTGVKGPFFADRCPGLVLAVRKSNPGHAGQALSAILDEQGTMMRTFGHGST